MKDKRDRRTFPRPYKDALAKNIRDGLYTSVERSRTLCIDLGTVNRWCREYDEKLKKTTIVPLDTAPLDITPMVAKKAKGRPRTAQRELPFEQATPVIDVQMVLAENKKLREDRDRLVQNLAKQVADIAKCTQSILENFLVSV